MTVASVHPDSASLEYHMEVAGPLFREFVELVTLSSIHIYGEPSEKCCNSRRRRHGAGRGTWCGILARRFHSFCDVLDRTRA